MRGILFFLILISATLASTLTTGADTSRHVPTIDELLTMKSIGGAQISPDGKRVAYAVTNADFKQDAFVTQVWLAEVGTPARNIQLTRGDDCLQRLRPWHK
jgi:hypothetical protein